jgi:hypothetical protein
VPLVRLYEKLNNKVIAKDEADRSHSKSCKWLKHLAIISMAVFRRMDAGRMQPSGALNRVNSMNDVVMVVDVVVVVVVFLLAGSLRLYLGSICTWKTNP